MATLDNPVKLDGFDFDKKPCTTATVPVVQGQKLSRAPLLSFWFAIGKPITKDGRPSVIYLNSAFHGISAKI